MTSTIFVGRSEAIAGWVAARLPGRIATFESFYEAWLDRLRARENTLWQRLRRPVLVLVLDTAGLVAVAIAAGTLGTEGAAAIGLRGTIADVAVAVVALVAAVPFAVGVIRRVARIARVLALEVVPAQTTGADLGRVPRRALTLTLALALGLVVAIPVLAVTQPLVSSGAVIVVVGLVALAAITYRSIVDFNQHVRSGSEVLLELMHHPAEPEHHLDGVEQLLPGFSGMVEIALPAGAAAIGRSLAELDLRARTGATVLAIARTGSDVATPSPTEPLAAGDRLAVTGSDEAIAAARALLGGP
jgi:CPA2 family monovalent cation:H+ antiporter-2